MYWTCICTHSVVLPSFLVSPQFFYHFLFCLGNFLGYSFRAGMLATSSLNFLSSKNASIAPSFLKNMLGGDHEFCAGHFLESILFGVDSASCLCGSASLTTDSNFSDIISSRAFSLLPLSFLWNSDGTNVNSFCYGPTDALRLCSLFFQSFLSVV